jgi:hypothetical protein
MQNVVSAIWYGVIVVIAALGIAVAFAAQPAAVSVDIADPKGVLGRKDVMTKGSGLRGKHRLPATVSSIRHGVSWRGVGGKLPVIRCL